MNYLTPTPSTAGRENDTADDEVYEAMLEKRDKDARQNWSGGMYRRVCEICGSVTTTGIPIEGKRCWRCK